MAPTQAQSRLELLEEWSKRVRDAVISYRHASDHHKEMIREVKEMLSEERYAVSKARRAEAWARTELERTVRIYAALMMEGKTPPPDDDDKLLIGGRPTEPSHHQ